MSAGKDHYSLSVTSDRRTCVVTFFFDGTPYSMPTRYYPEIESDIRANFYAWRAHAVAYVRQRARIDSIIDDLLAGADDKKDENGRA